MRVGNLFKKWAFAIVSIVVLVGCGVSEPTVVKSTDGKFQITMPAGWSKQTGLNDEADIQIANPWQECYVMVLSESKVDFPDPTIEWHSELTREAMVNTLIGGEISSEPREIEINGNRALQCEIRGTADGINIVWLHTTVDTEEQIHQILAWTMPSNYDKNRKVLQSVVKSFRSTKPERTGDDS